MKLIVWTESYSSRRRVCGRKSKLDGNMGDLSTSGQDEDIFLGTISAQNWCGILFSLVRLRCFEWFIAPSVLCTRLFLPPVAWNDDLKCSRSELIDSFILLIRLLFDLIYFYKWLGVLPYCLLHSFILNLTYLFWLLCCDAPYYYYYYYYYCCCCSLNKWVLFHTNANVQLCPYSV